MNDKTKVDPFKPIVYFFSRYNLLIFVIVITTGLSLAVLILTSILQVPYDGSISGSSSDSVIFDETTINNLNQLNTSDNNAIKTSTPPIRASLFSE